MKSSVVGAFALSLALGALPAAAESFDVPFVIDDASRVIVLVEDVPFAGLQDGLNQVPVSTPARLEVRAAEGAKLTRVREVEGTWQDDLQINEGAFCYINVYSDYGTTYYVESAPLGDVRTSVVHFTVDDPDKVILTRGADPVGLVAGDSDIPFDPASESVFRIEPVDYDRPFYSITHNETPVTGLPPYKLTVADGDRIAVTADFPDVKHKISVRVQGDYADDPFLTGLYVDGQPVTAETLAAEGAQAGSVLSVRADTRNYEVLGFTVDGRAEHFSDGWHTVVLADMDLDIRVRRYAMVRVYVTVGPHIALYRGQHYDGQLVTPDAEGHAVVDVPAEAPILTFIPEEGYHLSALTVEDEAGQVVDDFAPEDLKATFVNVGMLQEGDRVAAAAEAFVRDRRASLVISGYALAADYMRVTRADGTSIAPLAEGHNPFIFDPWDTPLRLALGGPATPRVFLNEEPAAARFPGSYDYDILPADASVIKVFFDRDPALCDITVETEAALAGLVEMHRDRVAPLGPTARVLEGTELSFALKPDVNCHLDVLVDETAIPADADGVYRHIVTGPCRILLTRDAAVTEIAADPTQATEELYDLQGRRVLRPAPGLYLTPAHRKVLVR